MSDFAVANMSNYTMIVPKKNVNGYTRTFSKHAEIRMGLRQISRADVKWATKNIASFDRVRDTDDRWRLVAKNGLTILCSVDDDNKSIVIYTCYRPEK